MALYSSLAAWLGEIPAIFAVVVGIIVAFAKIIEWITKNEPTINKISKFLFPHIKRLLSLIRHFFNILTNNIRNIFSVIRNKISIIANLKNLFFRKRSDLQPTLTSNASKDPDELIAFLAETSERLRNAGGAARMNLHVGGDVHARMDQGAAKTQTYKTK